MPLIFSYGTLQREEIQWSTFGRLLEGRPDVLVGFEASTARSHANVTFNGRDDSRVPGTIFEITDTELEAADRYEDADGYTRISSVLGSGARAWLYVDAASIARRQSILHVALVVKEYDEAIRFFCDTLKFTLVEDSYQPEQDKRWVVVAPPGPPGTTLLLARATTPEQEFAIGRQSGGRVFLFLETDDFWRDYAAMRARGVVFVREPKDAEYGTVAVFADLYGNLWDLVQRSGR